MEDVPEPPQVVSSAKTYKELKEEQEAKGIEYKGSDKQMKIVTFNVHSWTVALYCR
jgi:hypothetical protein